MAQTDIVSAVEPHVVESPEPPIASSGATIAVRLGELAKEALLSADNAALERWVDGLKAAGESPMFTERLRALSRLGRGDIGDALRVLRRTRSSLDPTDHKQRCQTSLALGVALSVAGRPQEALLEGMDALARARHAEDERGALACLAFLAKLYTSQGREEVEVLRAPVRRSVAPP
jgi:ATP/maltotriose-dependent transcriptional regulator MalT